MNFYFCTVTMQNPEGSVSNFVIHLIAHNPDEAIAIADRKAEKILASGWAITNTLAVAIERKVLEDVAERVLGWHAPA